MVCVVDLKNDLGPETDVGRQELFEKIDWIESILFIETVPPLILEFRLDVAEDGEEKLFEEWKISYIHAKFRYFGQVSNLVEQYFSSWLGLLKSQVNVDQLF